MEIQKILDYQTKDFEIIKLERQLANSPDKAILSNLVLLVKETQNASALLEKEAEDAVLQFNNLKKTYTDNISFLEKISKQDTDKLDDEKATEVFEKINEISSNLATLEKRVLGMADKINNILSEYNLAKKRYFSAREKHAIHKERFDKLNDEIAPMISALEKELQALEKGIDKTVLAKYKTRRQDKVFPIIVPVRDSSCGGCMMELPSAQIEKLKRNGFLECENCHRIIYLV